MSNDSISAIDKAVAAAMARKAAKAGANPPTEGEVAKPAKAAKTPKEPKPAKEPKRPRLTDEDKAARKAKLEAERGEKKLAREQKREAKKLEREANRKPAHMSKVEKAFAKLPTLNKDAQAAFDEITASLSSGMVGALAAHLQHFNRAKATERAVGQKVTAGDTVTIVGGDARYLGCTGTVVKAQRIRCYVEVEGAKKPVYLFTSDVSVTASAVAEKTGTEG